MEPSEIAAVVQRIVDSGLSVDAYFRNHAVPFSRPQYFRYKARLAAGGMEALVDGRRQGNHRKLGADAEGFLRGLHQADPRLSLQGLGQSLEGALGIAVDRSTVGRYLKAVGEPIQWPRQAQPETLLSGCGGFEIIAALAVHLGWAQRTAQVIVEERERFRGSTAYRQERVRRDRQGRNERGQFTGEYNRRPDIRLQRFASVEDKREQKNYSRMGLFQAGQWVLERKGLAVLALPLITLNGTSR